MGEGEREKAVGTWKEPLNPRPRSERFRVDDRQHQDTWIALSRKELSSISRCQIVSVDLF